jgi:hypothetical protein
MSPGKILLVSIESIAAILLSIAVYVLSTWPVRMSTAVRMTDQEWISGGLSTLALASFVALVFAGLVYAINAFMARTHQAWTSRFARVSAIAMGSIVFVSAVTGCITFFLQRPAL